MTGLGADQTISDEIVEKIAAEIAAEHRPSYERWQRARGPAPAGVMAMDHGRFVMTDPGGPDDSTMVSFLDTDGCRSLRSLTWREVTAAVMARAVPHIEAAIRADEQQKIAAMEPAHRMEWAVLSDDGTVYEVENRGRDRAHYEALQLRTPDPDGYVEPNARVVERQVCDWHGTRLLDPDPTLAARVARGGSR